MNPLHGISALGQSVWYDNISRAMIQTGELARMIEHDGLSGITSNPTIFEKAIATSSDYDQAIAAYLQQHPQASAREMFYHLAIEDIQHAADLLMPVFTANQYHDGFVSLEVSPDLAHDTQGTVTEAKELWARVNRPNLMIKVPATLAGIPAIEALISAGINVNATLLFSVDRYEAVAKAYINGLASRLQRGEAIDRVASVASFFVSRVDGAVEKALASAAPAQADSFTGKIAIANAKIAYQSYHELFDGKAFHGLAQGGAKAQRLLWASTGTKSKTLSDILYIETLIGKNTVTTVPPATYAAYKDHGKPQLTLEEGVHQAVVDCNSLKELSISLEQLTDQLEKEGVESFANSFKTLLNAIEQKMQSLSGNKQCGHACC